MLIYYGQVNQFHLYTSLFVCFLQGFLISIGRVCCCCFKRCLNNILLLLLTPFCTAKRLLHCINSDRPMWKRMVGLLLLQLKRFAVIVLHFARRQTRIH